MRGAVMENDIFEAIKLKQIATPLKPSMTPCGKPCPALDEVKERIILGDQVLALSPSLITTIKEMGDKIETMSKKLDDTKDIVAAWGNIKGFGRTMSFVSHVLKVATPIFLLVGFLYLCLIDPQSAFSKVRIWLASK